MAQQTSFEKQWRSRFQRFAAAGTEDADIAGWSRSGLRARVARFLEVWQPRSSGALWLDAGCGAGTYSRQLVQASKEVVGMDYSLPSIVKARNRSAERIAWIVADATQLPLRSESVDGVLCFGVTQALSESGVLLGELARVTRPSGEVWIDALNKWCLVHAVALWLRRLRGRPLHLRYESTWCIRKLMRAHGLTDVSVYWLPIVPGRISRFQPLIETRPIRWLFDHVPGLGLLLSHSVILKGARPATAAN